MKLLLLFLGLTMVCAQDEENHDVVTSNFDLSKISGEWHTLLLAADLKELVEENGDARLFMEHTKALDNSSLVLKYHKEINGECTEVTLVCEETEEKGVYDVQYHGYNRIHIAEAVYDEYIIFYIWNIDNGKITEVLELDAKTPDVSPQLKKRFEEHCRHYGIPTENVVDVSNADPCSQA